MTSWAIVAVPEQQDPVWKISSEKIPHMTLLYFGEQSDPELAARISTFVQHAVDFGVITEFGLDVGKRGTLGKDKADVLFFEDAQVKKVEKFRQYLLGNRDIRASYDSTQQYPSWTPHLTLGYPNNPAKTDSPWGDRVSYVRFDRIMVWIDDFDGPTFDLGSDQSLLQQSDILAHYGIKGMKWGVRRERDSSTGRVAKREAKAQKYETRAAGFQKQIDDIRRADHKTLLGQRMANQKVKELEGYRDTALRDAALKREGKLSTGQKHLAVGATVVGGIVVARATFKAADAGEFARLAQKGKSLVEGNEGKPQWKRNEMLASDKWDADALQVLVVDKINPDFGAFGTKDNCRRATFAYEMRRRGYDVKATKSAKATGQNAAGLYSATTPGEKRVSPGLRGVTSKLMKEEFDKQLRGASTPFTDLTNVNGGMAKNAIKADSEPFNSAIFKTLASQPDGARGELGMTWKAGGGHSMAWEVVKGKPVIFDTQSGKRYDGPDDLSKVGSAMQDAGFTRLDNIPLNEDFLMRWVRSND